MHICPVQTGERQGVICPDTSTAGGVREHAHRRGVRRTGSAGKSMTPACSWVTATFTFKRDHVRLGKVPKRFTVSVHSAHLITKTPNLTQKPRAGKSRSATCLVEKSRPEYMIRSGSYLRRTVVSRDRFAPKYCDAAALASR